MQYVLHVRSFVLMEHLFFFSGRKGIKSGIDWLVEQMERSKRTEVLRERAGVTGQM